MPRLKPRDAKTLKQICSLKSDGTWYGDYWTSLSERTFTITKQKLGEMPTEQITLPRFIFERFVNWYNTGKQK